VGRTLLSAAVGFDVALELGKILSRQRNLAAFSFQGLEHHMWCYPIKV
jgi:hypothetical protein